MYTVSVPLFAVSMLTSFTSQASLSEMQSCREMIQSEVCIVKPARQGESRQDRPCLEQSATYARPFQELYDHYPPYIQKMFCHLKRIFLETDLNSSAYADLYRDPLTKQTLGGIVGLRKSFIDERPGLENWASWKEQLNFGISTADVVVSKELPRVRVFTPKGKMELLEFLLIHEFGHLFDFANNLNDLSARYCQIKPGTWPSLSWSNLAKPKLEFDFPLRSAICFYDCKGNFIPPERQDEIYQSLAKTNFISPGFRKGVVRSERKNHWGKI